MPEGIPSLSLLRSSIDRQILLRSGIGSSRLLEWSNALLGVRIVYDTPIPNPTRTDLIKVQYQASLEKLVLSKNYKSEVVVTLYSVSGYRMVVFCSGFQAS